MIVLGIWSGLSLCDTQVQQILPGQTRSPPPTVVFKPVSAFFTSHNKWVVAFNIETQPYGSLLDKLTSYLDMLKLNVTTFIRHYEHTSVQNQDMAWRNIYAYLGRSQRRILLNLESQLDALRIQLDQCVTLVARPNKRPR